MKLAQLARQHGAGRFALEDKIDPLVGAIIDAPVGQGEQNDPLLTFYHNRALGDDELLQLKSLANVSVQPPVLSHRLLEVIDSSTRRDKGDACRPLCRFSSWWSVGLLIPRSGSSPTIGCFRPQWPVFIVFPGGFEVDSSSKTVISQSRLITSTVRGGASSEMTPQYASCFGSPACTIPHRRDGRALFACRSSARSSVEC